MVRAKEAKVIKKLRENRKWIVFILLIGILVLGNRLREFSYASVPNPGESADEYSFGWLGISLIKDKYPIAWSGIPAYAVHDFQRINVDGLYDKDPQRLPFSIDMPWFDHPPLFGLLTGGYAYIKGVRDFADASVIILRRPMLKIALVTTILTFILGWRLFGTFVGLLAALLYSVIPTTVISSRLALAENGYIPLFLGSLILAHYYLDKKKGIYWTMAAILAAVGLLFKFSAIAISISLILIALMYGGTKKKNLISTVLSTSLASLILFAVYGFYFSWDTFLSVLSYNSQRFYGAGAEIFLSAIVRSKITATKFLSDGWIVASWISSLVISAAEWKKEKGTTIVTIAIFSYLVVFLVLGSEGYGWYRFPFLPFLIIALSRLIYKLFKEPNLLLFIALALLPFGTSLHRLYGIEGFSTFVYPFRITLIFMLALFSAMLFIRKVWLKRVYQLTILAILVGLTFLAIKEIYFFNLDTWFFVT